MIGAYQTYNSVLFILKMKTNKSQTFYRKPAQILQQLLNEQTDDQSLQTIQRTKTLGFTNKICQVNIFPSPNKKQESLTYSIELTPITSSQTKKTSSQTKKTQSQKMLQVRKHLYGIQENFIQNAETDNEESLLLDYKQILDDQKNKVAVTPLTNCSYSSGKLQNQEQEAKQGQNLCSKFEVFPNEYKISFCYINKDTIRVHYVPSKEEYFQKKENLSLIARMKKLFRTQPLILLDFISSTLQKWSENSLKMFLLTNSIKFTMLQINKFYSLIYQMGLSLNSYQIAQNLFLTSDEQKQMVFNSQKTNISGLIPPYQNSFFKLYLSMIIQNEAADLRQFLPSIESFFRKVI